MGRIFRVGNRCEKLDCSCCLFDSKKQGEETPIPPLHEGCDCVLVEEQSDYIMHRPGKFKVTEEFFEQRVDELLQIMGRCIVARAEFTYHDRAFCYIAYSRDFDEVPDGQQIPEYLWKINSTEGTVSAERMGGQQ